MAQTVAERDIALRVRPPAAIESGDVECCCSDPTLALLEGDPALEYREHLDRLAQEAGATLLRCPLTGQEWIEDFPLDPRSSEWVGVCRLRRFPFRHAISR